MIATGLLLALMLGFSISSSPVVARRAGVLANSQQDQAKLRLYTTIVNERFSLERGDRTLRLTLKLTYTNDGPRPILLDRKSTLIYRTMVSKSLKAAASQRYIEDQTFYFTDLNKAGMRGASDPEEQAFIRLEPGESYTVLDEPEVVLSTGPKTAKEFLSGGDYFLQVQVATWYYWADWKEYRERWSDKGYLWSSNMTSEPMPFTVQKTP